MAVDTLGHLLALHVTPADLDDRAEVGRPSAAIQEATGQSVTVVYVDQGYSFYQRCKCDAERAGLVRSGQAD